MKKIKPNLRIDQYLSLAIWVLIFLTLPIVFESPAIEQASQKVKHEFVKIAPVPILKGGYLPDTEKSADSLEISATHVLAIDVDSASTLYEKNATEAAFPASTTKMVTALVVRDIYDLDQLLQVPPASLVNGNKIGLKWDELVRVEDLLKSLLIGSSNEAAYVLAYGLEPLHASEINTASSAAQNIPTFSSKPTFFDTLGEKEVFDQNLDENLQGFVNKMNHKAREIHLNNSLFTNPAGFDEENTRSSARDLAVLAREVMKDSVLSKIVSQKQYSFNDYNDGFTHTVVNTNNLLWEKGLGVTGIKTGTTEGAGQVLVTQVEREGRRVILVVMGSEDRYADTKQLIDWIFEAYKWRELSIDEVMNEDLSQDAK